MFVGSYCYVGVRAGACTNYFIHNAATVVITGDWLSLLMKLCLCINYVILNT